MESVMTPKADGGPAFPHWDGPSGNCFNGMSLRDYFAAAALTGAMANPTFWDRVEDEHGATVLKVSADLLARNSYVTADAMLAEREKK